MALYTVESIERVKDSVDMVELVGARTDLRRVGTRFTGLCPFHDERTPSFSVNAEHGLYHCFGCGASGDAIRFVQETEALDFKGAIELLAERYGVELQREQEDPREEERRRRHERLLKLVDRAADFYARYLWESTEALPAREYLTGRGLSEDVLRAFRVGYAPKAWDRIVLAAQRDGYSPHEIAKAGLGQTGRHGGFGDRFRGRIMFPLADRRGRVRGFGARALRADQKPKYLNTSENELFEKGRQLFGLDRARAAAAAAGRVVVVEGYTDVLALHQMGITEAVAIMGTALTQQQLAELPFLAKTVYLALDADRAGQEAMLRAARGAKDRELELLVVGMPEGTDPAELVTDQGVQAFTDLVDRAMTIPEFEVRRVLADADLGTPRGRDRALERTRPLIESTPPNSATRQELVRFVADRLDVPDHYLMTPAPATPVHATGNGSAPRADLDLIAKRERIFLSMCLSDPVAGRDYLGRLTDAHLSSDRLRHVRDWLVAHFEDPLAGLPADDPSLSAAVSEVVLAEEVRPAESVLRVTFLQLELRRIERALRHAEQESDRDRQMALSRERTAVRSEINELMGEPE